MLHEINATMLDSIITSKTRLRLLIKFFINAANEGHLRGLAIEFNESTNSIRKELNNLSEAGYLEKEQIQNKVQYKANKKHPLFGSLQDIVRKYLGLDTIVEQVLERMGKVHQIIITGDYANGLDTGIIEITIVGKDLNKEYVRKLSSKVEELISRKVHFTLSDTAPAKGLVVFDNLSLSKDN